ncbi:hypothetical protein CHUAL_013789 [Chamberlinius hualienensis]
MKCQCRLLVRFVVFTWVIETVNLIVNGDQHVGKKLPNILIMVADDLGWGDLGCYGNSTLRTPNIDSLAREGALFSHALAAASICTPSRAALLTGRYPIRTGLTTSGLARVVPFVACTGGLRPEEVTFARMAQQQNYSTALIGKWHLGLHCRTPFDFCHHPLNHGFDSFYGLPWSNSRDLGGDEAVIDARLPYLRKSLIGIISISFASLWWIRSKKYSNMLLYLILISFCGIFVPALMHFVVSNLRMLNGVVMRNFTVVEQPVRLEGIQQRFVQEAQDFIRVQHNNNKPFLMLLTFTHSHSALKPTKKFKGQSNHGLYGDIVEELDAAVGQMLHFLDEVGISDETFIVFTSDQGAHLEEVGLDGSRHGGYNGLFRGGKGMGGMEGGIRVPLLMRWPHHVTAGLHVRRTVSLMDIYPTVAELIGSPLTTKVDGQTLVPVVTKTDISQKSEPRFLVHYCGVSIHAARWAENETHVWKAMFATPNWLPNTTTCQFLCSCRNKFVTFHDPPLLYNIAEDETESRPISVDSLEYQNAITIIRDQIDIHEKSITPVENQLVWWKSLWLPWLQPCCNFPFCQCTENKYKGIM